MAPCRGYQATQVTESERLMPFVEGGGFMGPDAPDMQAIIKRLDRLEKQNRRLRRVGVLGLFGAAILLLTGQIAPSNRSIEAQKFLLTDTEGKPRGEWSADATMTQFALYDQNGARSVSLMADVRGNESTLNLVNKHGKRLRVSAFLDSGVISLSQKTESADWQCHFELVDRGGPDYPTTLRLWNAKGNASAVLEASEAGPSVQVGSGDFKTVIGSIASDAGSTAEAHRTSAASLIMVDRNGKVLWRAP